MNVTWVTAYLNVYFAENASGNSLFSTNRQCVMCKENVKSQQDFVMTPIVGKPVSEEVCQVGHLFAGNFPAIRLQAPHKQQSSCTCKNTVILHNNHPYL